MKRLKIRIRRWHGDVGVPRTAEVLEAREEGAGCSLRVRFRWEGRRHTAWVEEPRAGEPAVVWL